jgi:hypothetical protein
VARSTGIAEAACTVVLLTVYGATMAPSLTWAHHGADGGDLVTAVAQGSIPHPPGFPTYLLLGSFFVRLPWENPAWRLNLMSAALAAAAGGLTALAVRTLLRSGPREQRPTTVGHYRSATRNLQSAICAGLALGLAPLFWSQALIAEVYAPAAFFAALAIVLALRGGPAWALGLAWGVGMGAHPTLVFLGPLVVWRIWAGEERLRQLVRSGLPALAGWGAMYGPVLLARGSAPSPWGDVSTLAGWWALVSARLYHGYLFGLPLVAWPRRLLAGLGLLARQFTPFGAVLAGLGWLHLWRERRSLALASAITIGSFSLYAIGYDTADSLVYLVPALPVAALWLGAGAGRAADWLRGRWRPGAWAILMLPLLQAMLFWGQMDVSDDWEAIEWAERVLRLAPTHAALLTDQDAHTFTLWYVHDVLGERPDVAIVDQDLWAYRPYRHAAGSALGLETFEGGLSPEGAAHQAGRPVVRVLNQP